MSILQEARSMRAFIERETQSLYDADKIYNLCNELGLT